MQKIIAIADLLGFPAQMAEQEAERTITVAVLDTGIHEVGA